MTHRRHTRSDELGISTTLAARPLQAALASAGAFAVGAALPIVMATPAPQSRLLVFVAAASVVALSARSRPGHAVLRLTWARHASYSGGVLAMAVSAGVGWPFRVST
jgi:VIT1/CCC1 family predicted Fe2+/Mn2+ transporter